MRVHDSTMPDDHARRCFVVSAVNFTEGGPLTVLQDFVQAAAEALSEDWQIVAFVHDERVISAERVLKIEIPYAKHSWIRRMWFEWHEARTYSKRLRPSIWVSLHDISPSVGQVRQVVYCHNPVPFYRLRVRDVYLEPSLLIFRICYEWLYRFNIKKNHTVVVQQSWLRTRFQKWMDADAQILVAHPIEPVAAHGSLIRNHGEQAASFLYPALPRAFKNIELLCRAARNLESDTQWNGCITLTIDGTENRYARWLIRNFGSLRSVRFIGRQSREGMLRQYSQTDCLLFPSRLETWGLPITEAKQRGIPMFVADLPYAKESVGTYDMVDFIDVDDHAALACKLIAFQRGQFAFGGARRLVPDPPFVSGWANLIGSLIKGL